MSEVQRDRYARLGGRLWKHPKALRLSDAAGWLWTRALSYQVDMLTDGLITLEVVKLLGKTKKSADELVAAGLWDREGDAWRFHDFAHHSITVDQWETTKARKAKNKADQRAREREVTAPVTGDSPPPVTGDAVTVSPPGHPSVSDAGRRTQDAGRNSESEVVPRQVARAPRAAPADPPPAGARTRDAETIRRAAAVAFESVKATAPKAVRDLDGKPWHDLVDPVRELAEREGATIAVIADRLLAGFIASPRAAKAHWPIPWLVENPGQYLSASPHVSDFSHVNPNDNRLADD